MIALAHPSRSRLVARLACAAALLSTTPALPAPQDSAATPSVLPVVKAARACDALAGLDVAAIGGAGSRITKAAETTNKGVAVCSVEGTLASAIGFRVDLPTATWTQRFMQLGCGGLCGRIALQVGAASGCAAVTEGGFVTATTNMGHEGEDITWGIDPQKRSDFAYRSLHLTALTVKALIQRYYGQAARFSYFNGCSDGGREALIEAQRFPADFDGIIAGAAAMNFEVQNSFYHGWQAVSNTGADGQPILLADRLPILHAAVLRACDAEDGVEDGLISAPQLCHFDPATIMCKAGQGIATCLTQAEVDVARKFYEGPHDPRTGEPLTAGGPQYGSELAWAGVYVPRNAGQEIFSAIVSVQAMQHLIFEQSLPADYKLSDFTFDHAAFDTLRPRHPLFDATDPDLSAFAARGGKLIVWHGWADPHISPLNSIRYHEAVHRFMSDAKAETFERLYLLPGMYHCSGGEGPSLIDLLTPMMAWVERGQAPGAIVARQAPAGQGSGFGQPGSNAPAAKPEASTSPSDLAPSRSRPVYPYPYIAAYAGQGSIDDAADWHRGKAVPVTPGNWAGSDFYEPYASQP